MYNSHEKKKEKKIQQKQKLRHLPKNGNSYLEYYDSH